MDENQEKNTLSEPIIPDNSNIVSETTEEQAIEAPSKELILGKFKSIDELTKAYEKLEKFKGQQAQELGKLRQDSTIMNKIQQAWDKRDKIYNSKDELIAAAEKYNSPEYFQDSAFREIFKEAYKALGTNLDTDKFINLIEDYVSSRIYALEKTKSANNETEKIVNSMTFQKNNSSSITPPKKRLDEMTPKEVDELLERLI